MGKKRNGKTGTRLDLISSSKSNPEASVGKFSTSGKGIGSATATNGIGSYSSTIGLAGTSSAALSGNKPSSVNASILESVIMESDFDGSLDKLLGRACDLESFKVFAEMWEAVYHSKMQLRAANLQPSHEEFEKLRQSKKLDATLKKCTGFVKKLKNYSDAQRESIEREIQTLNLSKYLGEIASAITEVKIKVSDIQGILNICSALHQRYSEFAALLLENLKKIMPQKKLEMNALVLKKTACDLRLLGELIAIGILPVNEAFSLLLVSVRNIVTTDKETMQCVVPILSFCKGVGEEMAGILPANVTRMSEEFGIKISRYDVVPFEKRMALRKCILEYFNFACAILLKIHEDVLKSEMQNRRLMRTRGEIPEDRMQAHQELQSAFDKFSTNAKKLSEVLNTKLPELKALPPPAPDEIDERAISPADDTGVSTPGILIFDDEDTRSFYQDLPDLKVYLPPVAYRDNILSAAEEAKKIEEREKMIACEDSESVQAEFDDKLMEEIEDEEDIEQEELPPSSRVDEEDEKREDVLTKSSFQDFVANLLNCVTKDMIDKAAIYFAMNFNNKTNRKNLTRALFHIPRQRVDLIPLWSRFVAILAPVMPDISLELCALLKSDFRFLVRKKNNSFIETKLKITRFIGELVNFRIFPKSDAFVCLKTLLMNFNYHQVEMACVFIETCGRMLHRSPESRRKMTIYLEEMMRKRNVIAMEPRYSVMVDHAFYYMFPREGVQRAIIKKNPGVAYVRHLILSEISKENLESTISKIKKLDWSNDKVAFTVLEALLQPWETSSDQIRYLASFAAGVLDVRAELKTTLTDSVLEMVYDGLEKPQVSENYRRIAIIRYLGELYNYKMVGSTSIFSTLYSLICYDIVVRSPMEWSHMDPPHDLMRIRLACTLLKTCGDYLNHGFSKKKLNCFLLYLQRYYWSKRQSPVWNEMNPFPFVIEELMEDTVKWLRPKGKFPVSFEQACEEVKELETKMAKYAEEIFEDQSVDVNSDSNTNYSTDYSSNLTLSKARDVSAWVNDPTSSYSDALDEEFVPEPSIEQVVEKTQEEYEEDEAFNMLCDKMCSETAYTGARERMNTDISVPLTLKKITKSSTVEGGEGQGDSDTVSFVFLTRKGNKQNFKSLPVPVDSEFVKKIQKREEDERLEKEKMKALTLGISKLQEEEEEQEMITRNSNRGHPTAYGWKNMLS